MLVEPASRNRINAFGTSNTCLSKKTGKNVPYDTTNGMGSKTEGGEDERRYTTIKRNIAKMSETMADITYMLWVLVRYI
jgi:hypothetical protein